VSTATEAAKSKINDVAAWAMDHHCDVDPSAFREACREALHAACCARGFGFPHGIPDGVTTLALACSIVGNMSLPGAIVGSSLLGAATYRQTLRLQGQD
jgi:hypothetical protein